MNIRELIHEMTLEEKAGLCSGSNQYSTKAIERLGIQALRLCDGPSGLRYIQDGNIRPSVCFPTGSALASSFDVDLAEHIGQALGDAACANGVHTLLAPAVNMKRSPLCGRNFEYYSEDPYLAGELGTAMVKGIQSKGVAACPKHFAANNQEYRRMSTSANMSERTLREIYLSAFETIVKKAKPWSIMCSYNRINGVYSSDNRELLTEILRDSWGFDGIVITDWAAMNDRIRALLAGTELEMPSNDGVNDRKIIRAVQEGKLAVEILDQAVERILLWIQRCSKSEEQNVEDYNFDKEEQLAMEAAAECAVLLKNNKVLPLRKEAKILFIGGFAKTPRYQGGGSSNTIASHITSAWDAVSSYSNIEYEEGFSAYEDKIDENKIKMAVKKAGESEYTVVFAGLPNTFESEGCDRSNMEIPECQNYLIQEVCKVQPNTIVVFHGGCPVIMPWRNQVAAILQMHLGGQKVGEAAVKLLFGDINPSGKLAETYPLRLEDVPCFLNYPGNADGSDYAEGVFIGYRWYDKRKMDVQYPFGHGLSYTTFHYHEAHLSSEKIKDTENLYLDVDITNTGECFGKEIVQLYISPMSKQECIRPVTELKGFCKLSLEPGETKTAHFCLNKKSFAYYSEKLGDWMAESGTYRIYIGSSSRDLRVYKDVRIESTTKIPVYFTEHMTIQDLKDSGLDVRKTLELIGIRNMDMGAIGLAGMTEREIHLEEVKYGMPIHGAVGFLKKDLTPIYNSIRDIDGLLGKEKIPE